MAEYSIENLPEELKNLYKKAITAYDRKNLDYCIELASRALREKFDFKEARKLLHLAKKDKYSQKPRGIAGRLFACFAAIPKYIKAAFLKIKSDYKASIEGLEDALGINPYDEYALKKMASLFLLLNLRDNALYIYAEAYQLRPGDIEVLRNMAGLYHKKGKTEKAKDFYKKILVVKPHDYEAEKAIKDLDIIKTIEKSFSDQDDGEFEIKRDL
jgi:tetratricopeptide (TPR) repeat protein